MGEKIKTMGKTMNIHCKYDDLVRPDKLVDHPKNNNKHGSDQIDRLAEMYDYHGIRHPVIVSKRSGYIVAGHAQKLAAIRAGVKKFPVVLQDFDSDEAEYAFLTADNAIATWAEIDLSSINVELPNLGPDFDVKMLGLKNFQIEPADKEGSSKDDIAPQVPKKAKTKLGNIYQLGNHRLLCGDSTSKEAVEALMEGNKADMVFTDPPYNVASHSKNFTAHLSKGMESLSNAEWDKDCDIEKLISNLLLTVGDDFTLYIWTSQFLIQRIWDYFQKEIGDQAFIGYLVWNKINPMPSMSKRHPTWNTELCVYIASQGKGRIYNHKDGENFLSCRTHSRVSDGSHPTMKPLNLIMPILEASSNPESIIVDLFGGSGSTLIACENLDRICYMMELDPCYCDVIIKRWEKHTGLKAKLIEKNYKLLKI